MPKTPRASSIPGAGPGPYYISGSDLKGHHEKARDVKVEPWLMDVMTVLSHEIPIYDGKLINVYRDVMTVGTEIRLDEINDSVKKAEIERTFRLHLDIQVQAWEQQQFAQMQKFAESSEVTLELHATAKNWMLVSKNIELLKKRLAEGVLWEPHRETVESLVVQYTKLLKEAGS